MSNPASMIVGKNRIYWNPPEFGESHTVIRRRNGLRDGVGQTDGVAVELLPPKNDMTAPLDQWIFNTDQDILPDWWNLKEGELAARAELPAWLHAHAIVADISIDSGFWIVLKGSPTITVTAGDVWVYGEATPMINQSGGYVQTWDYSKPTIDQSGGDVVICGNLKPTINRK